MRLSFAICCSLQPAVAVALVVVVVKIPTTNVAASKIVTIAVTVIVFIPILLAVSLAFETMAFDITWLVSFLRGSSLPDSLFSFLFADIDPTLCNTDLCLL
jgi:hypothetical protein